MLKDATCKLKSATCVVAVQRLQAPLVLNCGAARGMSAHLCRSGVQQGWLIPPRAQLGGRGVELELRCATSLLSRQPQSNIFTYPP